MVKEGNISGVQDVYTAWFSYILAVSDDFGTEKALELLSRVVEVVGEATGKRLIKHLGVQGKGVDIGFALYSSLLDSYGVEHQIVEKTGDLASIKIGNCPIYGALKNVGWCREMREGLCKNLFLPYIATILRQVSPRVKLRLRRYRASSNDYCIEEIFLN